MGNRREDDQSMKNLFLVFVLNLLFSIVELLGGIITNSVAIISDALHDFGDSFSIGISFFLEKVSKKGKDELFTYGYRRFSLLGAFINASILIGGSIYVLYMAGMRLFEPENVNAKGMTLFAIFGIAVNAVAAIKIHGSKKLNERVVFLHLLEDVLGWIAVLIVGIVMIFINVPFLDPLLSIVISVFVMFNAIRNFYSIMVLFLQGKPPDIKIDELERILLSIDGVKEVHDLHLWSLDGVNHILSAHVVVGSGTTCETVKDVKASARAMLRKAGISHATIEVEFEDEECKSFCR